MRVYLTAYLRGNQHIAAVEVPPMESMPPVGTTIHWDDRAWSVDHVSLVVGDGKSYGNVNTWHAEIAVSA